MDGKARPKDDLAEADLETNRAIHVVHQRQTGGALCNVVAIDLISVFKRAGRYSRAPRRDNNSGE